MTPVTQLMMVPSTQTLPLPVPKSGMRRSLKCSVECTLFVTGFLPGSEEDLQLHTNGIFNQGSCLAHQEVPVPDGNVGGRER